MDIGDSLHISAVTLPKGVESAITDRDFTIATIVAPTVYKATEDAEGAEAGFDTGARGLFEAAAAWEPGRITFHVVAREPAEHLKHRHA